MVKKGEEYGIWLVGKDGSLYPSFVGLSKEEAIEGVDSDATGDHNKVTRSNPSWVKYRAYGPDGMIHEREIVRPEEGWNL